MTNQTLRPRQIDRITASYMIAGEIGLYSVLKGCGPVCVFELHGTHRHINNINKIVLQITAKPSKHPANLQPDATRNRTLKTRLHPRGMSHEQSPRPITPIRYCLRILANGALSMDVEQSRVGLLDAFKVGLPLPLSPSNRRPSHRFLPHHVQR